MARVNNPFKEKKSLQWHLLLILALVLGALAYVALLWRQTDQQAPLLLRTTPRDEEITYHQEIHQEKNNEDSEESKEEEEEEEEEDDDDLVSEEQDLFPKTSVAEFPSFLHKYYTSRDFETHVGYQTKLNRNILLESLDKGCSNLVHNLKDDGTGLFNYQYDFVSHEQDDDDRQVRQGGALWGLALCVQNNPQNTSYREALDRAIQFVVDNAVDGPVEDSIVLKYPAEPEVSESGTNALIALGFIEYLRTIKAGDILGIDTEYVELLESKLRGFINFLLWMQFPNRHFSYKYDFEEEDKVKHTSPYFDGECMLCLVKAAKYLDGYEHLIPVIEDSAFVIAKTYTVDAWRTDEHDSDETKGFYQWSSMFMAEYFDAGWKDSDAAGDYVVSLAHWIIHVHNVMNRTRNTGYAFEGIISAYNVLQARQDNPKALEDITYAIDAGLYKLTTWQVGGPLANENDFLRSHPTDEKIAIGGVMNHHKQAPLRIDTTQHQMHAVIMALDAVYNKE